MLNALGIKNKKNSMEVETGHVTVYTQVNFTQKSLSKIRYRNKGVSRGALEMKSMIGCSI